MRRRCPLFSGPALGLFTTPNPFSQTPAGTLKTADNVRFTAPGVIEPRRGFSDYTSTFGTSASRMDAFVFYGADILGAYDLTTVSRYTSGAWSDFTGAAAGAGTPVGTNRLRFEGAARSMFWTSIEGIWVWDGTGVGGLPVIAGNELPLTPTVQADSANGWLPADSAVAYRSTLCYKDAFGRVVEGPPSGRAKLINTISVPVGEMSRTGTTVTVTYNMQQVPYVLHVGDSIVLSPGEANFAAGAKTITAVNNATSVFTYTEAGAATFSSIIQTFSIAVSGSVTVPIGLASGITFVSTSNFVRLYRSEDTLTATATPSDEMLQVYESGYITATDISNGYIIIPDVAPESSISGTGAVALYTNANSGNPDGALSANFQPPQSLDLVYWANRMWYANTKQTDSATFSLLGVGSPDGIQVGDTFTLSVNGGGLQMVFTAAAADAGSDFLVYTNADPGANIERTANSLVRAINRHASNDGWAAYYVSDEAGLPGTILIQSIVFNSPFDLYASRAVSWSPQLPTFVAPPFPALASANDQHAARVMYSKLGQPDAVPLINYVDVNSDNDAILRIFPLHYRLLVFKTDGIYTCTNLEPFTITKLSAYKLLAPDSLCVLEDRVYALTDQGIITISDSGCVQISNCIDDTFNAMMSSTDIATLAARSVGCAYRSERQALLWTPEKQDDGTVTSDNAQAFVYSTLADGFTRYALGARFAAVEPTENILVYAPTDTNVLRSENKTLTSLDYFDDLETVTITGRSGSDITFTYVTNHFTPAAGDVLQRSGGRYLITAVSGNTVTILGTPALTNGSASIYKAIPTAVEFNKPTGGKPAQLKLAARANFLFRTNEIRDVVSNFVTETQTNPVEVHTETIGWGEFVWGGVPYGNPARQIVPIEPLPTQVAQAAQLAVGFSTYQALATYEFLGLDLVESDDSEVNFGG